MLRDYAMQHISTYVLQILSPCKLYFNLQIVPLWNLLFSVSSENSRIICSVAGTSTGLSQNQAYT